MLKRISLNERRFARYAGVFLLFALFFLPRARGEARPLTPLTTARSIHDLSLDEAAKAHPLQLRGVITYYDPYIDPRRPALFVTDATGSIFLILAAGERPLLQVGQQVVVTGVSATGDFAPVLGAARVRVLGRSQLPGKAPRVGMGELLSPPRDGQWLEVEGVVHAVSQKGRNESLELALRDGVLTATTLRQEGIDYERLVDAKVRLRGNEAPLFNHRGQLTGAHLLFPDLSTLVVEEQPAAEPFNTPVREIGSLMKYKAGWALQHRVHLRGPVTLFWPGRMICMRDGSPEGSHSLCAHTRQESGVQEGGMVDVLGFAAAGEFTPTLTDASLRATAGSQFPVPLVLTPQAAMRGEYDAELVTMQGKLISYDRAATDSTMILSAGNFVFSVVLPKPLPLPVLEEGTLVRVTGICMLETDGMETNAFPVVHSMRILPRTADEIRIVRKASWWNPRHTLGVLALAFATTLVALGAMLILMQRVKRQQQLLRQSEEQFRHLATHDALTRLPNRNAILAALSSGLSTAREQRRGICVAVVDLDHFKQINDTFGHPAGDEVLRQAAERLSSAVRDTDSIGRYGGEEFLIVLRNVNRQMSVQRSESIRCALGSHPVEFAGHRLSVTCSIGIAYSHTGSVSETALVQLADQALYAAKAMGRNRVEASVVELDAAPVRHSLMGG